MASKIYPGSAREPLLKPVAIGDLRPTQITVGFREVKARRKHWRQETTRGKRERFLAEHLIPVILGPEKAHYILDHHHLVLALHQEGLTEVYVTIVADLSGLDTDAFWLVLDQRNWMHPFDGKGHRTTHHKIPKKISGLKNDPYRSLAGELRRAGGYAKETLPFSEFLWADFLRRRIKLSLIDKDFSRALDEALSLARNKEANYLPGWCGPVFD